MKRAWNKTKIIGTLGPASDPDRVFLQLLRAGMDIARLNFSHGTIDDQIRRLRRARLVAQRGGFGLGIMQDLPGPKVRIGSLATEYIDLKKGQQFILTSKAVPGTADMVSVQYRPFLSGLRPGYVVYLNDGLVRMSVRRVTNSGVRCEITAGGRVYPRKGLSCPQLRMTQSGVTDYDLSCLAAGVRAGIDYVAVSFVQDSRDVVRVKRFLQRHSSPALVIAKIERRVALQDLDRIIQAGDAVMVARGDLGIEAELEQIPALQKEIIRKTKAQGKPVITATQMLDSMVHNPQPTRAEVTDIANAILDGTDAIMLSEETAVGTYPAACVQTMMRIARATERSFARQLSPPLETATETPGCMFSRAAVDIARHWQARVIVAPTNNAASLAWLSSLKPTAAVVAVTSRQDTYQSLLLYWGVLPVYVPRHTALPDIIRQGARAAVTLGLGRTKDPLVVMLTDDSRVSASNRIEVTAM